MMFKIEKYAEDGFFEVLCLTFTFFFARPSLIFFKNIKEFPIGYMSLFAVIFPIFCFSLIIFLLVTYCIRNKKISKNVSALFFGIAVAFFLQGFFLNPNFEALNGTEIQWSRYFRYSVVSSLVWIISLILPQVFVQKKKLNEFYSKSKKFICIALTVVQLLLIVVFAIKNKSSQDDILVSKDYEFELSEKQNTIVFVIDTLDTTWFESMILTENGVKEKLSDFTYFDNVVAGGSPTVLGMPTMLTGELYNTFDDLDVYYRNAYKTSTLFNDFHSENINIKLYTDKEYLIGSEYDYIKNVKKAGNYKINSFLGFAKVLYKLVAFIESPQVLKKFFWLYGNDLQKYFSSIDQSSKEVKIDNNDPDFYSDLKNTSLTVKDRNSDFILYHLFGSHGPYSMNENAQRCDSKDTSLKQQTLGAFKICFEYLDELKKLGLYDSCTIIITADHGGVKIYQNPAVFIKKPNEKHDLQINHSTVTFKNLYATFAKSLLSNTDKYGNGLFEVDEIVKERLHVAPHILGHANFPDDKYVDSKSYSTFIIPENARDYENAKPLIQERKFTLSSKNFSYIDKSAIANSEGFYGFEEDLTWCKKDSRILLKNKNISKKGLLLSFVVPDQAINSGARMKIYVNNFLVYEELKDIPGPFEIKFSPEEISSFNDVYDIRINYGFSFVPKELGINGDTRDLSLRIKYIGESK